MSRTSKGPRLADQRRGSRHEGLRHLPEEGPRRDETRRAEEDRHEPRQVRSDRPEGRGRGRGGGESISERACLKPTRSDEEGEVR
jgi:hypothetical protein